MHANQAAVSSLAPGLPETAPVINDDAWEALLLNLHRLFSPRTRKPESTSGDGGPRKRETVGEEEEADEADKTKLLIVFRRSWWREDREKVKGGGHDTQWPLVLIAAPENDGSFVLRLLFLA